MRKGALLFCAVAVLVCLPAFAVEEVGQLKQNASVPPAPPNPPSLSDANLKKFVGLHVKYNGGSAEAYLTCFQDFLQKAGGDVFCAKLYAKAPGTMLDISPSYHGAAESLAGNTLCSKSFWDSRPERRVPVLIHEYIHHMDDGAAVARYYRAAQADPSKQWDEYAMTSPAEYIACAYEWIAQNDPYDSAETKRQRLYRIDPAFYKYMVDTWIPNFYHTPQN